jgi:hypothetical protein
MKTTSLTTMLLLIFCFGCTTAPKQEIRPEMIHTIEKAEVLTELEAINVAKAAITDKTTLAVGKTSRFLTGPCFKIDFAIPKFARKGDRIWPVYKTDEDSDKNDCAVLVNAETGNTHFLILKNICSQLREK